jgi:hypothetical protein
MGSAMSNMEQWLVGIIGFGLLGAMAFVAFWWT